MEKDLRGRLHENKFLAHAVDPIGIKHFALWLLLLPTTQSLLHPTKVLI